VVVKTAAVARAAPAPTDGGLAAGATPPLDAATLARARTHVRAARTARTHGAGADASAEYTAALALLAGGRGLWVRAAEAAMAEAALGLSELARGDPITTRAWAATALAHARRGGESGLERRARRRLDRH
jgi:hypothetical protein